MKSVNHVRKHDHTLDFVKIVDRATNYHKRLFLEV